MVHQLVSLSDDLVVSIASTLSPAAYAQLRGCCSPLWHLLTPVRLIQQRGADTSTITTLEALALHEAVSAIGGNRVTFEGASPTLRQRGARPRAPHVLRASVLSGAF